MQEEYGDQVATISWNLDHDDPDSAPSEALQRSVLAKLDQLKLTGQNVIASEAIHDVLGHYGIFGLPAALVFAQDGQLARVFEGEFTYDKDLVPLVREMLGEGGP